MTQPLTTSFDSFNARALSPAAVAKTFVEPMPQYSRLSQRSHSLLVGPRGSGKTTLLKMLTPEALEYWEAAPDEALRVDYSGVFVPTDVAWDRQLRALGGAGLTDDYVRPLVAAIFTTHTLRAVASCLRYRVLPRSGACRNVRRLDLSRADEAEMSRAIAQSLHMELPIASLSGVIAALSGRLGMLTQFANSELLMPSDGRAERFAARTDLFLDLVSGVVAVLDIVEIFMPSTIGERWALLFDELELAPVVIREQLFSSMRSVDDRLLFKLSISPYSEDLVLLQDALSAMPGHDYEEILLTYGHHEDTYEFSERLMTSILSARQWPSTDPQSVLGASDFDTPQRDWAEVGHAYSTAGRLGKRFVELADSDASFAQFLRSQDIDPRTLNDVSGETRAEVIRKVNPLVVSRSAFRTSDAVRASTARKVRSRKVPDLYRGAHAMYAMLEGNPRWIIAVCNRLLDSDPVGAASIPPSRQWREVNLLIARFRALLATIPWPEDTRLNRRGLLTLLDDVGDYFFRRVVVDDFNPDPPLTLVVDSNAGPTQMAALGRALNAGAIIYIPDADSANILSSLRGKRFRLSYLFAPQYKLPIRLGRQISLGTILKAERVGQDSLLEED